MTNVALQGSIYLQSGDSGPWQPVSHACLQNDTRNWLPFVAVYFRVLKIAHFNSS